MALFRDCELDGWLVHQHISDGDRLLWIDDREAHPGERLAGCARACIRISVIGGALDISGQAIIDGAVVVIKDGRTDFSELQTELLLADTTSWSSTPSTCCT
jgi:hypothetical protein